MTVLVQVFAGRAPDVVRPDDWQPWSNVTSVDQFPVMAARKFLRERGGLLPEEKKLDVTVFAHYPGMAKNPNGSPFKVVRTELQFSR